MGPVSVRPLSTSPEVSYYNTHVDILASAKKHGIADEDIRHAFANALSVDEVDEDPIRYLILGPDTVGNLLGIVVLDRPNGPCVIHAMKMREKYRSLLPKAGE